MKIQVMSDLHLEANSFQASAAPDVDLVILAGDIGERDTAVEWAQRSFDCPVAYVLGNHEYYGGALGSTLEAVRACASGTNVHVLDNDTLVLGDVRIIGTTLWTDYRLTGNQPLAMLSAEKELKDFQYIQREDGEKSHAVDFLAAHEAGRKYLEAALGTPFQGKTVVVTHHAPSNLSIHPRYTQRLDPLHIQACFASRLEGLLAGGQVTAYIHGHCHDSFDYELYGTRVVCNPRMGPGAGVLNPTFHPHFVLEL